MKNINSLLYSLILVVIFLIQGCALVKGVESKSNCEYNAKQVQSAQVKVEQLQVVENNCTMKLNSVQCIIQELDESLKQLENSNTKEERTKYYQKNKELIERLEKVIKDN